MIEFGKHDSVLESIVSQTMPVHAVIYTDGGHKEPIGGYGFHGYLFLPTQPKAGHGCDGFIPTPTGYVQTGGKPPITVLNYFDGMGSILFDSTNNVAELQAFIESMKLLIHFSIKHCTFIMDSQYVLRGASEWLTKWKRNNFKRDDGTDLANVDLWRQVDELMTEYLSSGGTLKWTWVKGHSGDFGNTQADTLASTAIEVGRKSRSVHRCTFYEPKEFWKVEVETHPLLVEPRFFFTEGFKGVNEAGMSVYHMGSSSIDEEYGMIDPEASYSVVITPDTDAVIEVVRNFQMSCIGVHSSGIFAMSLDCVLKPKIYRDIRGSGDLFLQSGKRKNDVLFPDGSVLSREIQNPRKLFRAFDTMTVLQTILEMWINKSMPAHYIVNDITAFIYEERVGKKKDSLVNALIAEDASSFNATVTYSNPLATEQRTIPITLNYGQDLPKRRALNNIAEHKPRILVVTIPECDRAFRYQVIVECGNSFGIWAGVFSNLRVDSSD